MTDLHLSVVIPAYNEERRLAPTLEAVLAYLARQSYAAEIIVVDDGCRDATARLVQERAHSAPVPLFLAQHVDGRNHGKGAAVRRGMMVARGRFRLFMDADHAIAIDQLERFWPCFDSGYDAVIGVRDAPGLGMKNGQPWYRWAAGRAGNILIRALALPGMANTQTGFKMFTGRCIEHILPYLSIDRWGFDVEMLVVCRQLGYALRAVPVKVINRPGSKVKLWTYFWVLREVWQVRRNLRAGRYGEVPAGIQRPPPDAN